MSFQYSKVQVWAVEIEDQPGATGKKLDVLAQSKADLQFVLARRHPGQPGKGQLIVSPIRGQKQVEAAAAAGYVLDVDTVAVKIEGTNKPGLGSRLLQAVTDTGVNLQGFTATVSGKKFTAFLAFDNNTDADKGMKAIKRLR